MKVRVTQKAWYDKKILREGQIIELACEDENALPTWAEAVNVVKKTVEIEQVEDQEGNVVEVEEEETEDAEDEEDEAGNEPEAPAGDVKVGELPLVEKNLLLQEAEAAGVKGNVQNFKVSTLKAKIEAAKGDK